MSQDRTHRAWSDLRGLQELATRLETDPSPVARYERAKVDRIIRKLEGPDEAPGS